MVTPLKRSLLDLEFMARGLEGAGETTKKLVLGKYKLGRVLGPGTFTKVYYACYVSPSGGVAIKVINKACL
jgi:hypothetical protein